MRHAPPLPLAAALAGLMVALLAGEPARPAHASGIPTPFGPEPIGVEYRYPSLFPPAPTVGPAARRIRVDLSRQELVAFVGQTPVRALPVSTGDAAHPTIVGHFNVQSKHALIDLIGPDYYYRDVPYVMMFARPFYIHAAPWRAEFGRPESRGCVTLAAGDAGWLFDWAEVGTPVEIDW